MLIVLLGMARGVLNSFENNSWAKTSNNISVYQGTTSKYFKGYPEGRIVKPDLEDMELLKSNIPSLVDDVSSYVYLGSTVFSTNADYISINPQGVYPIKKDRDNLSIIAGRFINEADIKYLRKTLVIEEKDAKAMFGDVDKALGSRVDGLGLSWIVVGIYSHDWKKDVYIPFSTAKILSGNNNNVDNLQVKIKNVSTIKEGEAGENEIRKQLSRSHNFAEDDNSALYFSNQFTDYLRSLTTLNLLNLSVWVIGILTLLSGIVGVSNIMFVSVKERTHEIGIRRAIGAKPRYIMLQIITESIVITTLFGYIGVILGMFVTQIISKMTEGTDFLNNPTVSLEIALEITAVLIIAGSCAGFFPALKATKVKPVEALRDE